MVSLLAASAQPSFFPIQAVLTDSDEAWVRPKAALLRKAYKIPPFLIFLKKFVLKRYAELEQKY